MPKILVVEDNESSREMLSRRFKRNGFAVIVAEDGEQGYALARSKSPEVILMDISLPGIDVWQAIELLKSEPDTRDILKCKIAERKRIEERLPQLGSIIESSNDAIVIHTLAGTMVSWNAGAQQLYGYEAGEVLGKSGNILLPPERREELISMLDRLKSGERVEMHDSIHVRKNGEFIDVSTAISPVNDAAGKLIGAAAISREYRSKEGRRTAL